MARFIVLLVLSAVALGALKLGVAVDDSARLSLGFGFLLLAGYLAGEIAAQAGIPRITGYLLTGILFGPHELAVLDASAVRQLRLLDELALFLVAFAAGGELRWADLRRNLAKVASISAGQLLVLSTLYVGVALLLSWSGVAWLGRGSSPSPVEAVVLGLFSALVAYPTGLASTMGVILATKTSGPTAKLVLTTTIAKEFLTVLLLPLLIVVASVLVETSKSGTGLPVLELLLSPLAGALAGLGAAEYFDRIRRHEVEFLLGLAIAVLLVSHSLGLEPLLVALATGTVAVARSRRGPLFLESLERASGPVLVVFFTVAGAGVDPMAALSVWHLAFGLAGLRILALLLGTWPAAVRFGLTPRRGLGAGFLPHAGLSLGVDSVLSKTWPAARSLLAAWIPAILLAELVGPLAFRVVLWAAGEIPAEASRPTSQSAPAGGRI